MVQVGTTSCGNVRRSTSGCRYSAGISGWHTPALTSSARSDSTTLSYSSSNAMCGSHEITPRLIRYLLENFSSRCWPRSPPEIRYFSENWEVPKTKQKKWAHRRSSRQILAGVWDLRKLFSFLKHRLSIIITVAPVCEQQKKRTHSGGNQEIILSVSIGLLACAGQWHELNARTSSYLVLEGKNLVCYCNTISYSV